MGMCCRPEASGDRGAAVPPLWSRAEAAGAVSVRMPTDALVLTRLAGSACEWVVAAVGQPSVVRVGGASAAAGSAGRDNS
jgi:hypothetical protein